MTASPIWNRPRRTTTTACSDPQSAPKAPRSAPLLSFSEPHARLRRSRENPPHRYHRPLPPHHPQPLQLHRPLRPARRPAPHPARFSYQRRQDRPPHFRFLLYLYARRPRHRLARRPPPPQAAHRCRRPHLECRHLTHRLRPRLPNAPHPPRSRRHRRSDFPHLRARHARRLLPRRGPQPRPQHLLHLHPRRRSPRLPHGRRTRRTLRLAHALLCRRTPRRPHRRRLLALRPRTKTRQRRHPPTHRRAHQLRGLFKNPAYWTATLGMAMWTFAVGGISTWLPTFLRRFAGYPSPALASPPAKSPPSTASSPPSPEAGSPSYGSAGIIVPSISSPRGAPSSPFLSQSSSSSVRRAFCPPPTSRSFACSSTPARSTPLS